MVDFNLRWLPEKAVCWVPHHPQSAACHVCHREAAKVVLRWLYGFVFLPLKCPWNSQIVVLPARPLLREKLLDSFTVCTSLPYNHSKDKRRVSNTLLHGYLLATQRREDIYIYTYWLHCHHRNDSCIKMGNDENHFNVSLTVRDKVTRQLAINWLAGEARSC